MLAVAIAFFAVLAPFIPTHGAPTAPADGNDLFVDLGYQLNSGQRVVVRFIYYNLHPLVPSIDPKLTINPYWILIG